MRKLVSSVGALTLLTLGPAAACERASSRGADAEAPALRGDTDPTLAAAEIRALWERYGQRLQARDGEAAASLVTQGTFDLYDHQRGLALGASRAALARESLSNRYGALVLRVFIEPATLGAMSGRDAFVTAVDRGWVTSTGGERLEGLRVDGEVAYANLEAGQQAVALFRREGRTWKVDIRALVDATRPLLEGMFAGVAREHGGDLDAALIATLEATAGRPIGDAIWNVE